MPFPIPNIRISIAIASAAISHPLLPNEDAILLNAPPKPSTPSGASVLPVKAPTVYLRIQPTTTVYPSASASEPSTGITPTASPILFLPRISQALPKAPIGPDLVARPKLISPIIPVAPISTTKIR